METVFTIQEYKAFIDEENCIGCGKCIRVCPTDAIIGGKQTLHTIVPQMCTACSNCINTCPTDCITLSTLGYKIDIEDEKRLTEKKLNRVNNSRHVLPTILFSTSSPAQTVNQIAINQSDETAHQRKQQIADAIARVKARKSLRL